MDLNTIPSDFHWPTQIYRQEMTLFPGREELQNHSEERCGKNRTNIVVFLSWGGWDRVSCSQGWSGTPYVAKDNLALLILLPRLPKWWDYRYGAGDGNHILVPAKQVVNQLNHIPGFIVINSYILKRLCMRCLVKQYLDLRCHHSKHLCKTGKQIEAETLAINCKTCKTMLPLFCLFCKELELSNYSETGCGGWEWRWGLEAKSSVEYGWRICFHLFTQQMRRRCMPHARKCPVRNSTVNLTDKTPAFLKATCW